MARKSGKMKQRGGKNSSGSGGAFGVFLFFCLIGLGFLLKSHKSSHSNPAGARVVLNRGRV